MFRLRIITFNIKNSNYQEKKHLFWNNRKEIIVQIVKEYQPDIVGFQEVLIDQFEYLSDQLKIEYGYYGVGRNDGANKGEFCPIFYKRLTPTKTGTFWYGSTPRECSNTWQMYLPRICSWINFEQGIAFYNTHLDDRDSTARKKSIELLQGQIIENSPNYKPIIVGDFNCAYSSPEMLSLRNKYKNAYLSKNGSIFNLTVTSHGFSGRKRSILGLSGRRIIDHILVDENTEIKESRVIYETKKGESLSSASDHWPIYADLIL
jgi:endonuclease/exonuclease/phosphatase family metal-dependent hydrolase